MEREKTFESIMKDGDQPNPRDQAQGTVSSHAGVDSENSSGSVYHSTATNLEGDGCLPTLHHNSTTVSESDSTEHFSDAIQESDDTASVYSAEEAPQRDEGAIQVLVSKSSLHQWSASHSKISILQNDSCGSQPPPSRIPLQADAGLSGTQSSQSFQFERTVMSTVGSRIPIPMRLCDTYQRINGSKSEPRITSRPSSAPDREQNVRSDDSPTRNLVEDYKPEDLTSEDVPSSESENITAISNPPQSEGGLDKFRSEDLLGDSLIYIPLDSTDPVANNTPLGTPEVSQLLPTAPPLSPSDDKEKNDSAALSSPSLSERSPSYTIVSFSSQAFDVSDGEEPIKEEHRKPVSSRPSPVSSAPDIPVKIERIEMVELDRAHQIESLPAPPVEYLQVNVGDLIAMGQANAREALKTAGPVDSRTQHSDIQKIAAESSGSLKTLTSECEPNDDDYIEIDESPERSPLKKFTRFGKLKNKLQGRSSSKEMSLKKTGSSAKATLKLRRKPPKAPSRPSSAKRPITPPLKQTAVVLKPKGTTSGMSRFTNIRASIKQDVEKMKLSGKLDLSGVKKKSTADIVVLAKESPELSKSDLKEDKISNHSINDRTTQDQPSLQSLKDATTPGSQKISRDEDTSATAVLTPSSQTKLNTLTSRYRVQMRKYKSQVADLTELQNKSGALHDSLSQLKTQIISVAGGMPSSLTDLPAPIVMAAAVVSELKEEPTPVNSQIEEMTAENENLRSEIGRLHSNMNVTLRENKQLKEELVSLKNQLSTGTKTLTELTKANENAKLDTQKARRLADTYRRRLEEFQKSSNEQKVKNEEDKSRRLENEKILVAEVSALKNKLQIEISRRENTQRSLTHLCDEKESLESQIRNFQTTIADQQQQQREHRQEIEKARIIQEEYNLLQNNTRKLEAELIQLQDFSEELQSKLDSSEKREEENTQKLIQMSEDIFDKMNMIHQLTEKNRLEQERRTDLPVADKDCSREKRMRMVNDLKCRAKRLKMTADEDYKIISNLSTLMGFEVDYQDLAIESDKESCENTQLILKICSDFEKVLRNKDEEIEKQKQQNADQQKLFQEKQSLIEQLYEFVNDKNDSICRKSLSSHAIDNKDKERNVEKCGNVETSVNMTEEGGTKHHPDFTELYSMLEVKRHTLLRMESQIRSIQEVHARCGMRRTMQESRIGELETMLATFID